MSGGWNRMKWGRTSNIPFLDAFSRLAASVSCFLRCRGGGNWGSKPIGTIAVVGDEDPFPIHFYEVFFCEKEEGSRLIIFKDITSRNWKLKQPIPPGCFCENRWNIDHYSDQHGGRSTTNLLEFRKKPWEASRRNHTNLTLHPISMYVYATCIFIYIYIYMYRYMLWLIWAWVKTI